MTSKPGIPKVSIIVAMTCDRVIGCGDALPWHLPEDLQLFKCLTMGHTIIMGRKTYQSIGRPLPGRHNIVLGQFQKTPPGIEVCNSFMAGLISAAQTGQQVFVIGGENLYRKALPIASELHVSWVKANISGDKYFPEFETADWILYESVDHAEFHYKFYRRKNVC